MINQNTVNVGVIDLRIHHFFDIIRDMGLDKEIKPHEFGHSQHLVHESILENPHLKIKLVVECDAICVG